MSLEIERKFLVDDGRCLELKTSEQEISQGYLCTDPERTVRVRIKGQHGYLTVKGISKDNGLSREEVELEIPLLQAGELLRLCLPGTIQKTRYCIPYGSFIIEVDRFHGENAGLILAEVELPSADTIFLAPSWLGAEVTGDVRYYNAYLSQHPYRSWGMNP
ncbi:MAG: CYTH domain-containing protein [Saprospiraceae bacterium]|jgi:adenylate cyclase|nr:CYTH domain-containing protein [Saprospiraceae bacterium]